MMTLESRLEKIEQLLSELVESTKTTNVVNAINEKWLTEPQVMQLLNLSKRSMKRLRLSNKIRTSSATGKNFKYYRADVESYLYDNSAVIKRRRNSTLSES